jgi:hypothetical protein
MSAFTPKPVPSQDLRTKDVPDLADVIGWQGAHRSGDLTGRQVRQTPRGEPDIDLVSADATDAPPAADGFPEGTGPAPSSAA